MTKTDVANLALAKIGEKLISSLSDPNDKNARHASLHYGQARDEVLRKAFWSFAKQSVTLAAEDPDDFDAAQIEGWTYAYALPADFLKLDKLTLDAVKVDKFELRRVNGKRCVLCDTEDPVLHYVYALDTPGEYDPLFTAALVTLLASRLARAISGSETLETTLLQRFEAIDLPEARTADGHDSQSNENHPLEEILAGNLMGSRGSLFDGCDC